MASISALYNQPRFLTISRIWHQKCPEENKLTAHLIACLVGVTLAVALGARPLGVHEARDWALLGTQGLLEMPITFVMISSGTKHLPSAEVGLFFMMETVLGPLWVHTAGYEAPPRYTVYGGAVMLVALAVNCYLSLREEKANQEQRVP